MAWAPRAALIHLTVAPGWTRTLPDGQSASAVSSTVTVVLAPVFCTQGGVVAPAVEGASVVDVDVDTPSVPLASRRATLLPNAGSQASPASGTAPAPPPNARSTRPSLALALACMPKSVNATTSIAGVRTAAACMIPGGFAGRSACAAATWSRFLQDYSPGCREWGCQKLSTLKTVITVPTLQVGLHHLSKGNL